ncbi:SNAP receptor VAM3 [Ascoidea rubescens DSM 1968]|uniref:t-SNARE n=1 Tax=Ascoidea rubescens DSM 1968 TaxID=1344418 RepID=A0A1D2VAU2_9ASCO|nr:t-SNARE [Ascoidea rubescens DSM 1968]ODV58705.1 t-SNARE [Ascoidea rubescens DSM 1968]
MSFADLDIEAQHKPLGNNSTILSKQIIFNSKKSNAANPQTSIDPATQNTNANVDSNAFLINNNSNIISRVSNLLNEFANNITHLERLNNQLGTKRDNINLRNLIETYLKSSEENLNNCKKLLFDLQIINNNNNNNKTASNSTNSQLLIISKLQKELTHLNQDFNKIKRNYNERKNSVILNEIVNENSKSKSRSLQNNLLIQNQNDLESIKTSNTESTPLLQEQQQQQQQLKQQYDQDVSQYELDYHSLLVQQRNDELSTIHNGVQEINAIFKDLSSLVQEQGLKIDTVENNIINYSDNTQNASNELTKADNYQKKKKKFSCIVLLVLSIILFLFVLAVVS